MKSWAYMYSPTDGSSSDHSWTQQPRALPGHTTCIYSGPHRFSPASLSNLPYRPAYLSTHRVSRDSSRHLADLRISHTLTQDGRNFDQLTQTGGTEVGLRCLVAGRVMATRAAALPRAAP